MSELVTPYRVSYISKVSWIPCEIEDNNGASSMTCFADDADEILKRINGYEKLEQSNKELLEALKSLVGVCEKHAPDGNPFSDSRFLEMDAAQKAITNAEREG